MERLDTRAALRRLAAFGLPGSDRRPIAVEMPYELVNAARGRRVLAWVSAAVAAGRVEGATDALQEQLRQASREAAATTMAAHAATVSLIDRLRTVGLGDVRVLKACATGHVDYPISTDRFSSDVDLLIRRENWLSTLHFFSSSLTTTPRRPGWDRDFAKAVTVHEDGGVDADLHTVLTHGYFGLSIPTDGLFADPTSFEIAGTTLLALDGPNRLIHAANHVAASQIVGMHSMRDVLQLVLVSEVDWQAAIDRAELWRVDALFARGVIEAWGAFDVDSHPIVEWARSVEPSGRQRFALALAGDRPRGNLLTAPLALPLRRWPAYVLPIVFPSRQYLAANGRRWGSRATRMTREILGR